jgi:hypothetical protein
MEGRLMRRKGTLVALLGAAIATVAPLATAAAQLLVFTSRAAFTFTAMQSGRMQTVSVAGLPDGTTVIPFPTPPGVVPPPLGFGSATLVGASIVGGQLSSSSPFAIYFNSPIAIIGFGADFRVVGGTLISMQFLRGSRLIGTAAQPVGVSTSYFLGALGSTPIDHVVIGVADATSFSIDNLTVVAPEPSSAALLAAGLAALVGSIPSRRRRA